MDYPFYHPSKWGEGYYLHLVDSCPFKKEGDVFVELRPLAPPQGWKPRRYVKVFEYRVQTENG